MLEGFAPVHERQRHSSCVDDIQVMIDLARSELITTPIATVQLNNYNDV